MNSQSNPARTVESEKNDLPNLNIRDYFASVIDSLDDAVIGCDLNGIIVSWNKAAARVFGYEAKEIIGQSTLTLIPLELHHEEEEVLRQLKAGERVTHCQDVRVKKNGERVQVFCSHSPIKNANGEMIGVSTTAHATSEYPQSDENQFQLAAIVDSADDAIISKDLNGVVKTWNQGAERMFGYASEEMVGQHVLRLIPEELRFEEDHSLTTIRAGGRVQHYETIRMKKSGERFEVSVTISPIRDWSGCVVGASKIARDISDRKRLERLLIQSEKFAATGRMAATVAHEINNPLESLVNLIYLARRNSGTGGEVDRYLKTAEEELERVAHIARQTLGYYRDTGRPAESYLHELVDNVLAVYSAKLLASRITVQNHFSDTRKIKISRGEIIQVFSNIITNAVDAMRGGGALEISIKEASSPHGEGLETTIQDTGGGIGDQDLAKIFDPFFTTKGDLGTGIGLWVARQLVERRGGEISVASSTERGHNGTRFTIFLPFATPEPAASVYQH